MDKIDTIEFDAMSGQVGSFGYMSEDLARKGIDGNDPRIIGKRGDEFSMFTKSFFDDFEQASLAIDRFDALSGRNVLLDSSGKQYSVYLLWKKHAGPNKVISSDVATNYLVTCEWIMRRVK